MLVDSLVRFALLGSTWVLYLLLALSVVSFAATFERWVFFRRNRLGGEGLRDALRRAMAGEDDERDVRAALGRSRSIEAAVLLEALDFVDGGARAVSDAIESGTGRERTKLERSMTLLGTLGNNAPFIGLFGTVLGVIEAFAHLGTGDQNAMGSVPGPWDSWLVLRGIKTLGVRMDRHCSNAKAIVDLLTSHPAVTEVYYPGLPGHRGHEVAERQMRDFGGMVSFRVAGGEQEAVDLCARTRVFTLGESLGGVESLIEHPGRMTHASAAGSALEVPADLVRLSVGIESVDDLVADLKQALG